MKWFVDWIANNQGLFTGLVIGLAIAILFLTIGFWATILIALCGGLGAYFGSHPEAWPRLVDQVKRLFTGSDGSW